MFCISVHHNSNGPVVWASSERLRFLGWRAILMTADDTGNGLQAIRSGGMKPQHFDAAKLQQLYPRFCWLETEKGHIGTGFLVSPMRILTNFHVYQLAQTVGGLKFAVFDHFADQSMPRTKPKKCRLESQPRASSPVNDRDYAILDLIDDPGSERGFFELTSRTLTKGQEILVIGHPGIKTANGPQARPLTISNGHVCDHNSLRYSLAHTADTTPGSSGSVVLTVDFQVVALHHHGEPGKEQNNHAIPIWSILEHLIAYHPDDRFDLVKLSAASSRKLCIPGDRAADPELESIPLGLRRIVTPESLEESSEGLEPATASSKNVALQAEQVVKLTRSDIAVPNVSPIGSSKMQVEAVARDSAIVVYFRLSQLGAAEFANDRIAYAVRQLREIVAAELLAFTAKNSGAHPPESRSSVYGRFVILPGRSAEAVDFACAVMARARDQKVALTIGIAQGAILPTVDAMGGNVAGVPINYAARLAFLKLGVSFIAVEDGLALRASRARSQPAWSFIPSIGQDPTTEKVKQTTVSFRRIAGIDENPPVAANLAPVDGDFTSETACVIAVDIERYSENNLNDMVSKAFELLGQGVSHANQSAGGSLAAIGRCYAPGGDGGVFVYREGVGGGVRSAWTFATSLWNHCGSRVPVRIGVTLEDVVIVDEEYPVGTGVLEADMLSSHARLDAICCSQSFWTHDFVKKETEGWYQLEIQTKNGLTAFLVSNKKQPEKEASVNESHVDTAYRKKIEESLQRFQESADIRQIYERVHGHPPTGNDSQQWNAETAAKLAKPAGFDIDGPMGSLILLRDEWIDAGKDDASKLLHRVIDFCLPVRFHRDTIRSIMHQIESGQRVIVATGTRRGTQVAMAYLTTYLTQNKVVGRPRLAEPRDSETSFERVLDCPVFSDPRRTLVEIIHGIACQVNLETSTPLPKQDDSPDLNNYCKELNIKIRWSSRRNQLVFFVFVSNVAVHFGNKSRDEIIERLRCLLPDLFFVDLNCSTASLIDEADLGGI